MALKRTARFVKTTAIGGLLVILPVAVVLFVAGQILFTLYSASLGLIESEATPDFVRDNPVLVIASGTGILVAACFFTGLVVQTRLGKYLKEWFREKVIDRIPVLRAVTRVTERFAGIDGEDFAPVEVAINSDGVAVLGFLVERLPDDRCAVFVPASPVTTVGNVLIVADDKLRYMETPLSDAVTAISQWGVEASRLYSETAPGVAGR